MPLSDKKNFTILSLSILSVAIALLILLLTVWIFRFIPFADVRDLFVASRAGGYIPSREFLFYRIFILSALGIQLGALFLFKKRLGVPKDALSRQPPPKEPRWLKVLGQGLDLLIPVLIVLIVFIPDRAGLAARIFTMDQFYHIDSFVMAPAWAALKGQVLNIDVFSMYGVAMPILIGWLADLWDGFSYPSVLTVMLGVSIVYYILFYILLRVWTKDVLLASAGLLLYLKLQMFHFCPYILLYPARSPVRFFFDVFFLLFILWHTRTQQKRYLGLASLSIGLSLCYVYDNGVYQLIAFYSYLVLYALPLWGAQQLSKRELGRLVGLAVLPFIVAMAGLALCVGSHVGNPLFWSNLFGFIQEMGAGFGSIPFQQNLVDNNVGAFLLGVLIVGGYLLTLLTVVSSYFLKRDPAKLFICVVCVYGLSLFHYFIWRSLGVNYLVVSAPLILLLCYGFQRVLLVKPVMAPQLRLVLLLVAGGALVATPNFIYRSNVLNLAKISMASNKQFMAEDLSVQADIWMMTRLTQPQDEIPLISSFEVEILRRADRKPFFYPFPIIRSSFMHDRYYGGTTFNLRSDLERMMAKLAAKQPPYIFVEKDIVRAKGMKGRYLAQGDVLATLMGYVQEHYTLYEEGGLLVVYARKP